MGKDLKGKELGAGISQRKDGYYTARFTSKKTGKRVQKYFKKLQECRQWIADSQFIDEHTDLNNIDNVTFDFLFNYCMEIKGNKIRKTTYDSYIARYEKNIKEYIGNMLIRDIKPVHVQSIFTRMANEKYGNSTIHMVRVILKIVFDYAVDNDIIIKSPLRNSIESKIGRKKKTIKSLTVEEQKMFLEGSKTSYYHDVFAFILQTGMRIGEVAFLKWSGVDFKNKVIYVEGTTHYDSITNEWYEGETKTESGRRCVPMTDVCYELLMKLHSKRKEEKVLNIDSMSNVFLTDDGRIINNHSIYICIGYVCDKVGIEKFGSHKLRHTFATRCIEAGMKPKTLQKILGHSNIDTTMNIYVDCMEETKAEEMDLFQKYMRVM